jgi:ribosomal protein L7/L12
MIRLWVFKLFFRFFPPSRVSVHTWRAGFQKVLFTQELRNELGLSLAVAKALTDDVLANRRIVLLVSKDQAETFVSRLNELGANARLLGKSVGAAA